MKNGLSLLFVTLLLAACSQTRNMPEGEVLYKGIKEISYGQKAKSVVAMEKKLAGKSDEGVITAVADAISKIDSLLSGKRDVQAALKDLDTRQKDKSLTRGQRDSLRAEKVVISEAYATAKEEVEAALACAPNGSVMGSSSIVSPWPIGLYVYNAYATANTMFGKWVRNTFGQAPVYISTVNPRTRAQVARNVLRNYGFFNADAEYDLLPLKDSLKAKIAYSVYPGQLYRLDSIEYPQWPAGIDTLVAKSVRKSVLKSGDAFSVVNLDAEKTRISDMLHDRGYYNFRPEYVTFKADTVRRQGWVQLRVEPSKNMPAEANRRYVLGDTRITMLKYDDYDIVDSAWRSGPLPVTMYYSGGEKGKAPLRLGSLRRFMFYKKGDMYSITRMSKQSEVLSGLGVFSQLQMGYTPRPAADSLAPDTLDVSIMAMLDKPYDSEFSANFVSKSNGMLGPGVSYSISKKNAFRRAETLKFKAYGSYEWQTGAQPTGGGTAVNSYEVGGQMSVSYPRLIMPHGARYGRMARTSTDFAIDVSWMNRANYYSMAQFKWDMTYKYQGRRYISHVFTPLSIKFTSLLSRTEAFDKVLRRSPALSVSMRDQVVPSMEYTINMTSRAKAHHPRAFTMTVKQAGNVVSCAYAAFGQGFGRRDKELLGVPFAQFVRLTAEYKQEKRMGRSSLVGRVTAGFVYSYGNSTVAPYADLFCVGGANSIRAFCLRGIGPGRYNPASSGFSYIDQMGDLKFEMNAEYRFPVVGDLHGAVFVDAGNVWLRREDKSRPGSGITLRRFAEDLAVGTGAGLRYDMSFLVLRFDVGVGVHAPYDTGKKSYCNMPKFWDSLGFHLAVGYPF